METKQEATYYAILEIITKQSHDIEHEMKEIDCNYDKFSKKGTSRKLEEVREIEDIIEEFLERSEREKRNNRMRVNFDMDKIKDPAELGI